MRALIFSLLTLLPLSWTAAASRSRKKAMDPLKERLTDISKVYKDRIAFLAGEKKVWDAFWKKMRDDRGQFEVRLDKQRTGFIDSLRSVPAEDHVKTLVGFERLQRTMMRSFEEDLQARIQEFMAVRLANMKEFSIKAESERARLQAASAGAWGRKKAALQLAAPSAEELRAIEKENERLEKERIKRLKKEKKRSKHKKRKLPIHEVF